MRRSSRSTTGACWSSTEWTRRRTRTRWAVVHNWSGRNSEGYPTTTALLASHFAPDLPIPYLSFGGFSNTSGVARFTRIDNADLLREIAAPALTTGDPHWELGDPIYFSEADWAALQSVRDANAERFASSPNLLPRDARHLEFYRSAYSTEGLKAYADAIPPEDELEEWEEGPEGFGSSLRRQAQLTVLAFKTGVAVSADLWLGGFDTHANHDPDHGWLLGNLTDSIDYLWEYAEEHGVADRLVVVWDRTSGARTSTTRRMARTTGPSAATSSWRRTSPGPGRGGRDRRPALRAAHQPAHAAPGRPQRHHHLPQARAQGAAPLLRHRELGGGEALPLQQHRGLRVLLLNDGPSSVPDIDTRDGVHGMRRPVGSSPCCPPRGWLRTRGANWGSPRRTRSGAGPCRAAVLRRRKKTDTAPG